MGPAFTPLTTRGDAKARARPSTLFGFLRDTPCLLFPPHPPLPSASQAVLSRMPLTLHATRPKHLTALRTWCKHCLSGRDPSRHCSDARVYALTTTAMHDMSTPPSPPSHLISFFPVSLPPSPTCLGVWHGVFSCALNCFFVLPEFCI